MIGLDTDVLVRYITQDDPEQSAQANAVVDALDEEEPGFVSIVTFVELYWVLTSAYGVERREAAVILRTLSEAQELVLESPEAVRRALGSVDDDADLADAVIAELGVMAGCRTTVTLDRRAGRLPGMSPVPSA
ncbi:PIN domain-containing protein [Geodermatophilus sp. URMC 61]|uniref:PIN domain-containing protein n=1 Tax=Geodermatophilus sp. URMC 61 TaxID=3423411 RepID=UPI00406C4F10